MSITMYRDNNGTIGYYNENGRLHSYGGPAVIRYTGTRSWYKNGYLHRLDGPAIEWYNGECDYYIEGKKYTYSEFIRRTVVKELTVAEISVKLGYPVRVVQ